MVFSLTVMTSPGNNTLYYPVSLAQTQEATSLLIQDTPVLAESSLTTSHEAEKCSPLQ